MHFWYTRCARITSMVAVVAKRATVRLDRIRGARVPIAYSGDIHPTSSIDGLTGGTLLKVIVREGPPGNSYR